MLGSKDAIRIVPYFVLPQFFYAPLRSVLNMCHWHIAPQYRIRKAYAPLLCSYRGESLSHKTTLVQAHRGFRLLTLASLYSIRNDANESLCYRKSNSFRLGITKIYLLFYDKIVNFANKKTINNGYGMYKKKYSRKIKKYGKKSKKTVDKSRDLLYHMKRA